MCPHCGGPLTTVLREYPREFENGGLILARVPFLSCAKCGLSDQPMDVGPMMDALAGVMSDPDKAVARNAQRA